MKVVQAEEMSRIEKMAFDEGASEENFMEQAGIGIARETDAYIQEHALESHVTLLCGKGNNAGDAYVAACYLKQKGYHVEAIDIFPEDEKSPLCIKNAKRFQGQGGYVHAYHSGIVDNFSSTVWLDGIFGTGFRGDIRGNAANVCEAVNASNLPIVSIDIPSGLNGNTGTASPQTLKSDLTIFLGLPKTGFFIRDGYDYTGQLCHVDFGLPEKFYDLAKADYTYFRPDDISVHCKTVKRSRHKYESGCVLGIAGSPEMPGAALLASHAALRAGAGMVYLLSPKGASKQFHSCPAELICFEGSYNSVPEKLIRKATSLFVGPGLSEDRKAQMKLSDFLHKLDIPCVIDASALNILAADDSPKLPKQSILTPHFLEMHRLLGFSERHDKDRAFLQECHNFAIKHNSTVILKGGPTFIFTPFNLPIVIAEGNPGLAKAGTGDVLTGILAALVARGISTEKAAVMGTYLHALAGEIATLQFTHHGTMAQDIIDCLPEAYHELLGPLRTFQEDINSCLP